MGRSRASAEDSLGEELVADVRDGVAPWQMVARKVLAVLGGGGSGMVAQAAGGPSDPRRHRN